MSKLTRFIEQGKRKNRIYVRGQDALSDQFEGIEGPIDTQHLLISMMLPPAVKAFVQEMEREVEMLCGKRHEREGEHFRWGRQPGSVIIGNQHVAIEKARVRSSGGQEVPLQTYARFQDPSLFERAVFHEGLKRVSQRDYGKGVQKIASSFGFQKSSVSRRWINATAKKLEELQKRDLARLNIRAVFLDGKRFSNLGVMVAMGVGIDGSKFVLGIYQCSSEHHQPIINLLNELENRGLPGDGLLFIVDGGSGLNKALDLKYNCHDSRKRRAIRIRCHVHKGRNLEGILGDAGNDVAPLFWSLRDAETRAEAEQISARLENLLRKHNLSALESYREAKEDLLVIHDLRLSRHLKRFFSTTNPIESLNSLIEEDMRRVKRWRDSSHFQRWIATYCLANEKRMRRPRGYKDLPALWIRLRVLTNDQKLENEERIA